MRARLRAFTFVSGLNFGLGALAIAGCSSTASLPDVATLPVMDFERTQIDAGELTISDARTTTFSFPFSNRGTGTLEIRDLVSSCSCAVARVEGMSTPPGETGRIDLQISRLTQLTKDASVVVSSNDPANSPVTLRVTWRLVAPIEVRPDRVDFGMILSDATQETVVEVVRSVSEKNGTGGPIERVECVPPDILTVRSVDGEALPIDLDAPCKFRVRLSPGNVRGQRSAAVHFHLGGPAKRRATLFVLWHVRDRIEVVPARLSLGVGRAGDSVSAAVVVSTGDDEPLEIRRAVMETWKGLSDTRVTSISPGRSRIVVTARLPDARGPHSARLRVDCAQPVVRVFEIPVSVFVSGNGGS